LPTFVLGVLILFWFRVAWTSSRSSASNHNSNGLRYSATLELHFTVSASMPRTVFPPTPGSSTDLKGADGSKQLDRLHTTFMLPESALAAAHTSQRQLTPIEETAPSKGTTYTQPSETVKSRRRSSAAQPPRDQFALPPPPTRSRKIIQKSMIPACSGEMHKLAILQVSRAGDTRSVIHCMRSLPLDRPP
jgi:hypothetical protein